MFRGYQAVLRKETQEVGPGCTPHQKETMTTLTDAERRALDEFIVENWNRFQQTALNYLSEEDIEALSDKLKG